VVESYSADSYIQQLRATELHQRRVTAAEHYSSGEIQQRRATAAEIYIQQLRSTSAEI
jgi:hypothetical protein